MKRYGPEPPWRGRNPELGSWKWTEYVGPELWMAEPSYWLWVPPPRAATNVYDMNALLKRVYMPAVREVLNEGMPFMKLLEAELASLKEGKHAKRAELRAARRLLKGEK